MTAWIQFSSESGKTLPLRDPDWKIRGRAGARLVSQSGSGEIPYPNLRTRRLRKTQRAAGPRIFSAVGPLLRL